MYGKTLDANVCLCNTKSTLTANKPVNPANRQFPAVA